MTTNKLSITVSTEMLYNRVVSMAFGKTCTDPQEVLKGGTQRPAASSVSTISTDSGYGSEQSC